MSPNSRRCAAVGYRNAESRVPAVARQTNAATPIRWALSTSRAPTDPPAAPGITNRPPAGIRAAGTGLLVTGLLVPGLFVTRLFVTWLLVPGLLVTWLLVPGLHPAPSPRHFGSRAEGRSSSSNTNCICCHMLAGAV